jgi:hypothetical protein
MALLLAILLIVYVINSVIIDRSRNDGYLRLARLKFATVVLLSARWLRFAKTIFDSLLFASQCLQVACGRRRRTQSWVRFVRIR